MAEVGTVSAIGRGPPATRTVGRSVLFVIGVGRSGTTLLQSMLHAHPKIAFLPETHFFRRYVAGARNRIHARRGAAAFLDRLSGDRDFARCGITPEQLLAPYLSGARSFRPVDAYLRLLVMAGNRSGAVVIGDKDPRNIDYLSDLAAACPAARVLHIVRDPRDVTLSRLNAEWSSGWPYELHLLVQEAQLRIGRREGRRLFGDAYREIRYEDLLDSPESELEKVCEWLEMRFRRQMLQFGDAARELIGDRERSWKREATGPLLRDNTRKWPSRLSVYQIRLAEAVCREAFEACGYRRAQPEGRVRGWRRLVLATAPIASRVFTFLYRLRP